MAVDMSHLIGKAEQEFGWNSLKESGQSDLGKEDFLTMLVAQLSNQDPMNPMEDKEFTAQLAQFSSLEQLTEISAGIDSLAAANSNQQMISAAGFIGKHIRAEGDSVSKDGEEVSTLYFDVDQPVSSGYLNIFDASGNLLRTEQLGSRAEGTYEYNWDGKDYQGQEMADGVYFVYMSAEDAQGEPVMINTDVSGEVVGVTSRDGNQYLRLSDGRVVDFMNIKEVVDAGDDAQDGGEEGGGET